MEKFRLPILASKTPLMITYFLGDRATCTSTLLPYPWDHKTIKFIRDNNIQVGEELKKRILIPQWAKSLHKERLLLSVNGVKYFSDWESYKREQEFYGKF